MSCYGWERGEFTLSTLEFRRFKNDFLTALNRALEADYQTALKVYEALLAAGKGKRKFDWEEAFNALMREEVPAPYSRFSFGPLKVPKYEFKLLDSWNVRHRMLTKPKLNEQGHVVGHDKCPPRKPTKTAYAGFSLSKTLAVQGSDSEASVSFDPAKRQLVWNVSENNHSVERARESLLGRLFFEQLGRVKWTRGTGGHITGNDEYRREGRGPGEGGNELKETYGPRGDQERDVQYRSLGLRPSTRRKLTHSAHR